MFTNLFPNSFFSNENVFSTITTASAPRGITPPVAIIVAVSLATEFWGTTPQACGVVPQNSVAKDTATIIATGGVIPRGADAVVMVENTFSFEKNEFGNKLVNILKPVPV